MELLYKHLPNENWVNCGASIGDTILSFFALGLKANKIWAFEANKKSFDRLCSVVDMLPEEMNRCVCLFNETLDENTSFGCIDDKVTLLNADIEGFELSLLKSMEKRIINDRPVIAICVYHRKEDLIEIPQYIDTLMPGCHFYLRKHTPFLYNYNRNHELVLYAVPDERIL